MNTRKVSLLFVAIVSASLIAGCVSNNHTMDSQTENSGLSPSEKNNNGDKVDAAEANAEENASDKEATNSHQNQTESKTTNDITEKLKMDAAFIKQPTNFPVKEEVKPEIVKNEENAYSIAYHSVSGEELAKFSGIRHDSVQAASDSIGDFMNGKEVEPFEEGKEDLGYGITGYGEGAAGHAYFSWKEGNWLMSIASINEDEMNNQEIAKKMVEYLETHMLPAPKDSGIVYAEYPQGGEKVNVDIRWQDEEMIYQLETTEVPLDALEMATSVE
ncbi:hypothetical protein DCC39_00695 [Pueribacillus theae]|uniref:Lipoprotein n=1 Tax=Pueribacillus theae TaxID=2171751 RepID=A0A2U1K8C6_9BACI|nr:hypothetical protein [Pueribacillus theae]PWA13443.1 hypothetical protein DCC39_00695 [Pueribacillus theae]